MGGRCVAVLRPQRKARDRRDDAYSIGIPVRRTGGIVTGPKLPATAV